MEKRILVWFLTIALLVQGAAIAVPCSAGEVWSDDFNDENYEGWTVFGSGEPLGRPFKLTEGEFSTADKTLQATGEAYLDYAKHPSLVATGTWSFDVYVDAGVEILGIAFMTDEWELIPDAPPLVSALSRHGYVIWISPYDMTINLEKWVGQEGSMIGRYRATAGIVGLYHIDVTRDADGQFYVYLDGRQIIDEVDNEFTESEYFVFISSGGENSLDNIVVSDTIDIAPTGPETPIWMQPWFLATIGVVVVVVIGAVLMLRRR